MDNITCKVVLVGESGVGKTCIIQRYINNSYNENTESTQASTYSYKTVEYKDFNKSISFDIWDTAGQELYRAVTKNFYINASIGILVYDIKRKESFEAIKNYWFEELKSSGEDNMIFGVAGNKCDLFQQEQVTEEEGKKFAKSIGAVFHLTSCKESIGIDELFEECGKKYLEMNKLIDSKEKGKIHLDKDKANNNNNNEGKKKKCC
jgi:Ras-related protein Rab-22